MKKTIIDNDKVTLELLEGIYTLYFDKKITPAWKFTKLTEALKKIKES